MSHDIVNELIAIMGHSILQKVLSQIKCQKNQGWFSLIAEEATDVNNREQLNLSIRYVDDDYVVHEEPIGLCSLPNTFAETVYSVLKDLLLHCD